MDVRVGPQRRLSNKELMLLNCGFGKTLESPLDSKEIKPINPKVNLPWIFIRNTVTKTEAPIFGHMVWKANSLEKTLMMGKTEGKRRRRRQRMRWLDSITDSMDMNLSKIREIVKDRGAWCAAVHAVSKSWTWLSKWKITTKWMLIAWANYISFLWFHFYFYTLK